MTEVAAFSFGTSISLEVFFKGHVGSLRFCRRKVGDDDVSFRIHVAELSIGSE